MAIFCTIYFVCSYSCVIPQIIKLIKTKSSNDYSLGMILLQFIGVTSWSLYIFTSVQNLIVYVGTVIDLLLLIIVDYLIIKYYRFKGLTKMPEDRLKHSYAVGSKMVELGKTQNFSDKELEELFLLGYLHDIGYQFGNNENHNNVGGNILKEDNYKYWKEVYYHGIPNSEYKSLFLNILNTADMMVDKNGNDVGFDKRLDDIKSRYGEDSIQYNNCVKIVNELRK